MMWNYNMLPENKYKPKDAGPATKPKKKRTPKIKAKRRNKK